MKKLLNILALGLSLSISIVSCDIPSEKPAQPQKSSSGAETVDIQKQFKIPVNAQGNTSEQQNVMDKNRITSDPTKIMWMHLVDYNGRMYLRTPVRSKITSSHKRLEPISCSAGLCGGEYQTSYGPKTPNGYRTTELIQIDGTYGQSDEYVYWFDPMGHYFQKGNGYILSDIPIDIKDPINEITGLYQANEAAIKWQKDQETKIK